jgi:hypothetical protein
MFLNPLITRLLPWKQVVEYIGARESVIHKYVRWGKLDCVQSLSHLTGVRLDVSFKFNK